MYGKCLLGYNTGEASLAATRKTYMKACEIKWPKDIYENSEYDNTGLGIQKWSRLNCEREYF